MMKNAPGVRVFPIGGRTPSADAVAKIHKAVLCIPDRFLRPWLAAGGRLDIVPGMDASVHPTFSNNGPAAGYCCIIFCVIAGDYVDASRTAIHEIGHAFDNLTNVSKSPAWRRIWNYEKLCGRVPQWAGQRMYASEFFAESFALLWSGNSMMLENSVEDFIAFGIC
jgi:hypothetical protein